MKYRYNASIVGRSSTEPAAVSVMAQNEQETLKKIVALPGLRYIKSIPIRDTN